MRDFLLIDDTDSLYSFTMPVQYPKAGTTNSAARVGVVSATRRRRRQWLAVPGDPRNNYIARMDWAARLERASCSSSSTGCRTRSTLMLGDARTGAVQPMLIERDSAWVDVVNDLALGRRRAALHLGERADGWRHSTSSRATARRSRDVTPGDFDVVNPD